MGKDLQSRRLVVILHADIVGSTMLVQLDEAIAHSRFQSAFRNFSKIIKAYGGVAHEIRGDALVAEFELTTDAVNAALAFQAQNLKTNKTYKDDIKPQLRIGISLGEVIIADKTITGSGVVMAQRLEQLADPGGIVVHSSVSDTAPKRMPYWFEALGEQVLKGFDEPVRCLAVSLRQGESIPKPEIKVAPKTDKPTISRTSKVGMSLLGIMMLALIGIGTLILLDKPPGMETTDYLTEKTEQTYSRLQVRFEWIPVLFHKEGSGTRVGQQQVTDEKLSIVEVDGKAENERVAREKLISGGSEQETEEKRATEQALVLAQLELEARQRANEKGKQLQAERERKAEAERIAQQKKIQAEKERQLQEQKEQLARQQAEQEKKAELERKQAEEKRLAELKRKKAEAKRQAELKRKEAEEKRLAELRRKEAEEKRKLELERKAEEERQRAELERLEAEKQNRILSLLSTADLYFDNGDYTNAQVHYQKVLALNPAEAEKQRAMQRMENTEVALLVMKRSDLILLFHDVRGTYSSDITVTTAQAHGAKFAKSKYLEVILKQNKDKITGTFSGRSSGEIEGILDEDIIKFEWFVTRDGNATLGSGEWKVTNNGLSLTGTWKARNYNSGGKWDLTRIE